jgi:hypothetical protein
VRGTLLCQPSRSDPLRRACARRSGSLCKTVCACSGSIARLVYSRRDN